MFIMKSLIFFTVYIKLFILSSRTWALYPPKEPPYSLSWVREGRNARGPELSSRTEIGKQILRNVSDHGLNESRYFENVMEPEMFKKGYSLKPGDPGVLLAAFNKQKRKTKDLAKYGYASLEASKLFAKQFLLTRSQITFGLERVDLERTSLYEACPFKNNEGLKPSCPAYSLIYRTLDGTCNNIDQPEWGSAFRAFSRFLPPDYSDGVEALRKNVDGDKLPNPRKISSMVHREIHRVSNITSQMVMQWGQFLDHDITATAQPRGFNQSIPKCCSDKFGPPIPENLKHPDCLPIEIDPDDSFFSKWNHTCMEFLRSSPAPKQNCALGPRGQINQVTSFIDASNVYGSDDHEMAELRLWQGGMLRYKPVRFRKPLLPPLDHVLEGECRENSKNLHCFSAGDLRVNEQPGLVSMHTLWMREHNRIVTVLTNLNPHWNDDRLFFEARKIVAAQMQKITYSEWLPVVLGPAVMKIFRLPLRRNGFYRGYKKTVNPTATNAFGAAAFRFGHSLVQNTLARCDKSGRKMPFSIRLHNEMMNPANIHNFGSVDRLLLGFVFEMPQSRDVFISNELTRHLFQSPGHHYGMDLAAINIQRGRDHGLPSYNIWREQCGLPRFNNWGELLRIIDDDTVGRLSIVYKHVDDIDLFTGGLAERPVVRGLVGPTFACILGQQFLNLRQGDRFWFENGGMPSSFTKEQLKEIRKTSLTRVLCDNLDDVSDIQQYVMRPPTDDKRNPKVSCSDLSKVPQMDLSQWKEAIDIPFPGLLYAGGDFNFSLLESGGNNHPSSYHTSDSITEKSETTSSSTDGFENFQSKNPNLSGFDPHYTGYDNLDFQNTGTSDSSDELDVENSGLNDKFPAGDETKYSTELPTPFIYIDGNYISGLAAEEGKLRSDLFGHETIPLRQSAYNFHQIIKEAYTNTLFYKRKKK